MGNSFSFTAENGQLRLNFGAFFLTKNIVTLRSIGYL